MLECPSWSCTVFSSAPAARARLAAPWSHKLVAQAVDILADRGPSLGRPMVDHVEYSTVQNLKELRPGSAGRSEVRILFVFDPWRSAILLVAGDKAGNWQQWYRHAIPRAEQLLEIYLQERAEEEERGQ
jgi:hypothetical protein